MTSKILLDIVFILSNFSIFGFNRGKMEIRACLSIERDSITPALSNLCSAFPAKDNIAISTR